MSSQLSPDGLILTLPGSAPDADISVAALEFSSPVQVVETVSGAADSSAGGTPLDPANSAPK